MAWLRTVAIASVLVLFPALALRATDASTQPDVTPPAEASADANDRGNQQSEAERIAELQESIENDQKQLDSLDRELENPESEYALAEKEFRSLNTELEQASQRLNAARVANNSQLVVQLEQEVESLGRQRHIAEERFDLAIEDRKTLREQRTTLRHKLEKDKAALASLTGDEEEEETPKENTDSKPSNHSSQRTNHSSHHDDSANRHSDSEHHQDASSAHDKETESSRDEPSDESSEDAEEDEEIVEAMEQAEEKDQEADEAQAETRSIAARLADIQKLVAQEQKELDLAKKKVDLATAAQLTLSQELERRQAEKADASELTELRNSIIDASKRLIQARSEVSEISERLNDRRAEQASLQAEHILALHEAEKKRQEAADAELLVKSLRNPFAPRNILQWLIDHGPRLLLIVVGMFLFSRLASFFALRSIRLVSSGTGRGSTAERENRARTLVGVFQNAASVGIFVTGTMMVLEEVGANITVLMGGVAVIGLAVAFGAQNLIKDYFYGFVMLLENQYMLNDSVRIGGVSGQVERITLRMTVLRDSNGIVHFIPNGTINSVSNETHGWSRAVCEIAVSYSQDLHHVQEVLRSISQELKRDPAFGPLLMELPSEPAIDSLGESAIYLKMVVKTLPNKHGAIKQEWLRRIHQRFSELGIEHPFPQRTLHVRHESDAADASVLSLRRAG